MFWKFKIIAYNLFIAYNIDVSYEIISSGNCALEGMTMLSTQQECDQAAQELHLGDITSTQYQFDDRAHGCVTQNQNYLVWAPAESHPYANVPCGTNSFDCICAKSGKINFALIKYKGIFYKQSKDYRLKLACIF